MSFKKYFTRRVLSVECSQQRQLTGVVWYNHVDMKEVQSRNTSPTDFLKSDRGEIAEIIKETGQPKCVAVMLDGTRRVLKLKPGFHDDRWLYHEDHITGLIHKSIEVADTFFDCGLDTVIGPLASLGNLNRKNFMPLGLERLLNPLLDEYSLSIYKKHNAAVTFYGDLDGARNMQGGEIIDKYIESFKKINPKIPQKHILIGIGFSTDRETEIIANLAIDYYKETGKNPIRNDLIKKYFGQDVPAIDIFIRTNEVKMSGGLTPLLTQHDTQLYFPVAPGIMSLTEPVIKSILYDYLYSRILSHGMHEHSPITEQEAEVVSNFYEIHQNEVLGLGRRVGDLWIHDFQKE